MYGIRFFRNSEVKWGDGEQQQQQQQATTTKIHAYDDLFLGVRPGFGGEQHKERERRAEGYGEGGGKGGRLGFGPRCAPFFSPSSPLRRGAASKRGAVYRFQEDGGGTGWGGGGRPTIKKGGLASPTPACARVLFPPPVFLVKILVRTRTTTSTVHPPPQR